MKKLQLFVASAVLSLCSTVFAQPQLNSSAAIVMDATGTVVLQKSADTIRPIASISKLLVGSVMITRLPIAGDLSLTGVESITVNGSEYDLMFGLRPKHDRKVAKGSTYTAEQLLNISLISSNNIATAALARQLGLPTIIEETNLHAQQLGLTSVYLVEPTGLSRENVASARDLATFAFTVVDTDLARISVTPQYTVEKATYNSTNVFTKLPSWSVLVQKTGFTNAAGRCMLLVLEIQQQRYAIVLLGAPTQQAIWKDVVSIRKYLGDSGFTEPRITPAVNKRRGGRP
jgi:D-alanyl-D-alanine endopeptidase (penicillin-binding protein 7)